MKKRYLILEDGSIWEGEARGADADAVGELVFTTGMTGYTETLTDPSYAGQIVLQTFPLIGNYGVCPADFEGVPAARGYVAREICAAPSNFRAEQTLDEFLREQGIPAVVGVDTRALTRRIRESGVMNAAILDRVPDDLGTLLAMLRDYRVRDAVASVTCATPASLPAADGKPRFRVVLLDFGAKRNIARELSRRGCAVQILPASATAREILAAHPDGVMLSNGPGDPAENTAIIREIGALFGKLPLFGICLGHQLMALAAGARTEKLKYGHRGANHPVRDLHTGRTYITSQNHGYAVLTEGFRAGELRYVNGNDMTCEGIDYPDRNAFSVQFHPEACGGPQDTAFLFDRFTDLMERSRTHAAR